jgi:hypothetical protein
LRRFTGYYSNKLQQQSNQQIQQITVHKITGYNHNIVFKKYHFCKENGTQVYETFPLVTIQPLQQHWPSTLIKQKKCANSKNDVYNYTSEALILTIDPTLLLNELRLQIRRVKDIGSTKNILTIVFQTCLRDLFL